MQWDSLHKATTSKFPEQLMLPDGPYTMHLVPDGILHMCSPSAALCCCICRSKLAEQLKPASPSCMLRCIEPPYLQEVLNG